MSLDIIFHKGVASPNNFEWFGLKLVSKMVDQNTDRQIIHTLWNFGGLDAYEGANPSMIKDSALRLKSNITTTANWLIELSRKEQSLYWVTKNTDDGDEHYTITIIDNLKHLEKNCALFEFEHLNGPKSVFAENIAPTLEVLGKIQGGGRVIDSKGLEEHANLLYHNGILLFDYLMNNARKGRFISNDFNEAPELFVKNSTGYSVNNTDHDMADSLKDKSN
jgi:hypothetical protein